MRKWKQRVAEANEKGYGRYSGAEQALFTMTCSVASNLLDILVIDEPFYWYIPEWVSILEKYEVNKVLIDLNSTNGDKLLDGFIKAGFKKTENITSYINGRGAAKIKGVVVQKVTDNMLQEILNDKQDSMNN